MSKSNDQYKSIPIEFLKADFGYSKMGRCVTLVRPKSEAERLGVKIGWLEENVIRRTLSNHKKRRRKKSQSKSCTYLVHFLVPRRQVVCKVIWRALASTHREINHPKRKIVGSVDLGIVLWVMDIIKNRALVACPKSGWNRDVSGWIPNQPFAWLSIRAKDGTDILENVSVSELCKTVKSSSLSHSNSRTTTYPLWHTSRSTRTELPVIQGMELSRSHISTGNPAIHVDFREKQQITHKAFIDLEFEEIKNNSMLQNLIPLDLKVETALSEEVDSQVMSSSISGTNSKVSLSRSKTLADSYVPEAETKRQHADELGNPNFPEKRASVSWSDAKQSSKRNSFSRDSKLSEEEISSKSLTEKKLSIIENNLSVLIPDSKLEVEEIDMWVERRSLAESTLTSSSFESKYTNRTSELSNRRCVTSDVENVTESTRKKKIKEIETFAMWLAQGCETPISSLREAEDKILNGRIVNHLIDENVEQRNLPQERVSEPLSVKTPRSAVYDRMMDSGMFSINADKPQSSGNMNTPFRFNVEREAREKHGTLICSADV